jgi:hypothetical protein
MGEPVRVLPGEPVKRSGGNTCLIGCIGSIIVVCVLVFILVLAVLYGVGQLRDRLTSETPEPLPEVVYTQEQAQQVQQRVRAFEAALETGSPTPMTLEMTAQELNVLLHTDPRFTEASGRLHLDIQEDNLIAQVSMPMDGVPGLDGRWLNGSAAVDLDVVNDRFVVSISAFNVHGLQFPREALSQVEGELNKNLNQDPEIRALAARIQDITVRDGRVFITLEGGQP